MTPEDIDSGSFTFPSTEKLKYRKSIQILFDQGRHISIAPIRVIYLLTADDALPKFGISVPKRYFLKAVDRNKVKRRVRESYRLQKHLLKAFCLESNIGIDMMWIYASAALVDQPTLQKLTSQILDTLILRIKKQIPKKSKDTI